MHPANRVPPVTPDFWLIKLLAVTVGETAADYLAVNLGLGLSVTTWIMSGLMVAVLLLQLTRRRYIPWAYWLAVVMISIVGTLITDSLVDTFGVPLELTTLVCTILLLATFAGWYLTERTLSIHTIFTARRELFYWTAILLTFAVGTAAGDLLAEKLDIGYLGAGTIFAAVIAVIAGAFYGLSLNAVVAFWLAYIFTRPLGASFGDLLSQPAEYGGLGLGTVVTSAGFLVVIITVVSTITLLRRDEHKLSSRVV